MIPPPTVGPLWGLEIQPELRSWRETSGEHCKSSITCCHHDSSTYCRPSLGLGNPARAEILEGDVWGPPKIENSSVVNDSSGNCRPSLGLGNTARAEILEGDVWRAPKTQHTGANDSNRPSLGLGNTSQSRDPGGRRLESTQNAAHRAR